MKAASGGDLNSVDYLVAIYKINAVVKVDGGATMGGDKQNLVADFELL